MKKLGVYLLVVSIFLISFSSASFLGDIWNSITGNAVSGNDCSYRFNGALHTGKNDVVGLENGDGRFLCYQSKFYECGWEGSMPLLVQEATNSQLVGSWKCDLQNKKWISNVVSPSQPMTCTSFTYSNWSACQPSNTQARTVLTSSPSGCTGGNPNLTQSCVWVYKGTPCTSYDYSNWSACTPEGYQTRGVTASYPEWCAGGSEIVRQNCTYDPSVKICSSFNYTDWSLCGYNGKQTRTVTGSSPSGCVEGTPVTSRSCEDFILPQANCTSYEYSGWSACNSSGKQTRGVLVSYPKGCKGGSEITTQSCVYDSSVITCSSFNYSNWSECSINGSQTRSVTNQFPSGCTGGQNILFKQCTHLSRCILIPEVSNNCDSPYYDYFYGLLLRFNSSVSCRDSDPENNLSIMGTIVGSQPLFSTLMQAYYQDNFVSYNDSCSGNNLIEYSCVDGRFLKVTNNVCENGCSNGACLPRSPSTGGSGSPSTANSNVSNVSVVVNNSGQQNGSNSSSVTLSSSFGQTIKYSYCVFITSFVRGSVQDARANCK